MMRRGAGLFCTAVVVLAAVAGADSFSLGGDRFLFLDEFLLDTVEGAHLNVNPPRFDSLVLIAACVLAPLSATTLVLVTALFLLGLGWNFCFVGGSTLLADQLSPAERARTQGVNDLLVGLASATGSLSSGLVFAATSYTVIAVVAGGLSLIPLILVLTWMRRQKVVVGV